MDHSIFNPNDIKQMKERGISPDTVLTQIEIFRKGFLFSTLLRPCTAGDGIVVLNKANLQRLEDGYEKVVGSRRVLKFVPASGAATRMVKALLSLFNRYEKLGANRHVPELQEGDPDYKIVLDAMKNLKRFAFFRDLKSKMAKDGLDTQSLVAQGHYEFILEYILTNKGLNMANLPKGLIPFHHYSDHERTPFEEHIVEAGAYARDNTGIVRVHFTVPDTHEAAIKDHIAEVLRRHSNSETTYDITFSTQKPSTDTIAVDTDNQPFRDADERLEFRPGGHGALLENLNDLQGDIIFIKNIDNVVPDRLKPTTYMYKKALGAYLLELQDQVFTHMERLFRKEVDHVHVEEIFEFGKQRLFIIPPDKVLQGPIEKKIEFLISRLNRPLRVCGMVKNEGEPGGGPFWVANADGTTSLQIIESAQVDMKNVEQKKIWESSTHFNPVDLVCGVRDFSKKPFPLMQYRDTNTGFISIKSKEGRELKALELPGLWNGAMAYWNTVFVEVPIITFNPVKTIVDLLRKEHQPE